ncbi:Protein translocase SEC61 complex gamma [Spironucleus salmonicida]|uniref:Protein translocase SEC61 complex gamma n=1 Tax=Spironucleus salmonicida TaxID=348837 RepID=V6LG96_9EUKA|nr:Protein translocase SEC61 complex gamma [Spironucleus salmonicida]|eukprot:EST43580.1 Protein translocase SEC61 complex gamma [Spironucleus salmonicida]
MSNQPRTNSAQLKTYINRQKNFINSCAKPQYDEWKKLAFATGTGIFVIGMAAYVIKAVSYPIFTKFGGMSAIVEE